MTKDARSDADTMSQLKEIKLQLPVRTHVRLRAEKLLHGATIASTVNAAVVAYFQRHPVRDELGTAVKDVTA